MKFLRRATAEEFRESIESSCQLTEVIGGFTDSTLRLTQGKVGAPSFKTSREEPSWGMLE